MSSIGIKVAKSGEVTNIYAPEKSDISAAVIEYEDMPANDKDLKGFQVLKVAVTKDDSAIGDLESRLTFTSEDIPED